LSTEAAHATPKRILIVEDDPDTQEAFCTAIGDAGFDTKSVKDGREALDYLRGGGRADAILLDLMMPRMDGWQFRRRQLADQTLAHIPVVVVSAARVARNSALGFGAAIFLGKPVHFEDLLGALSALT
jgi:CheY-like chemotaxis protein